VVVSGVTVYVGTGCLLVQHDPALDGCVPVTAQCFEPQTNQQRHLAVPSYRGMWLQASVSPNAFIVSGGALTETASGRKELFVIGQTLPLIHPVSDTAGSKPD
jgi:hypothetical protein